MGTVHQETPPEAPRPTVISERTLLSWGAVAVLIAAVFAFGKLWADVEHVKTELRDHRQYHGAPAGIDFQIRQAMDRLEADGFTLEGRPRVRAVNKALEAMGVERRVTAAEIQRTWLGLSLRERQSILAASRHD